MKTKNFLVIYEGTGRGRSRGIFSIPVDDRLWPVEDPKNKGVINKANLRTLAERKVKDANPRSRDTIRIVKVEPRDSAEDIMTDKIKNIAAKYGHEMQSDAIEGSQKAKDEQAIREMSHKLAAMKNEYKKMAEAFARKYGDSKFTRFLK